MASTGKKWAVGCGIGCLLGILILGGVGTCGYFGIKHIEERADDLHVHMDALDERFGPLDSFAPPADGSIDAATIQIFLAARDDLRVRSADLAEILQTLDGGGNWVAKVRASVKLVPSVVEYVGDQAAVLLEHDLHPGEYAYLYAVAYYSWLGYDPGDGPGFSLSDNEDDDHGQFQWQVRDGKHDVHRDRAHQARRALNDLMITWLGSQREALADGDAAWAEILDRELAALRADTGHLAWEDGLPQQLVDSLEPYRDAFEASYDAPLNAMEVAILEGED